VLRTFILTLRPRVKLNWCLSVFSLLHKIDSTGRFADWLRKHLALEEIMNAVVLVLVEVLIVIDCRGSWVWDAGGLRNCW